MTVENEYWCLGGKLALSEAGALRADALSGNYRGGRKRFGVGERIHALRKSGEELGIRREEIHLNVIEDLGIAFGGFDIDGDLVLRASATTGMR
jgi:hypothetical protein